MKAVHELGVAELSKALAAKQLSSVEATQALYESMGRAP